MNEQSQTKSTQGNVESEQERLGQELAGRYMTFRLADEDYGIAILNVVQLIRLQHITRVPRMPDFVRGVINLRGKVIPTVDLRSKFGMGRTEETDHTVIIVVQHETDEGLLTIGLLVDEVLEVVNLAPADITPTPNFGGGVVDTDFILSLGTAGNKVLFLLDIGLVLSAKEWRQIEGEGEGESVPAFPDADGVARPEMR
jgi:purine-binding chemotaxis protein CheW